MSEVAPVPLSRRTLLRSSVALLSAGSLNAHQTSNPRPFTIHVPAAKIQRILKRLREAQWPDRLATDGWEYGVRWGYMKELVDYWITRFAWQKAQETLNRFPQFKSRIGEYDIHFYYVRGAGPRPLPIILTHGWPGSVFEFHKAVEPLTHPERFGASASDAFDVVIPSLPGFGFSSKPVERPIGPSGTAQLWNKLMTNVLGYRKYGAQGGDWGAAVTMQLAQLFPDVLYGIHLNAASGRALPEPEQTPEERSWAQSAAAYRAAEFDYYYEQQRKPQTVAFALSDNPLGAAAWIIEKFRVWSDSDQNPEPTFTKDELITNLMIYLTTDTMGSAIWFYRGALEDNKRPREKITVPTGFAAFPKEMVHLRPPKSWLERDFNLVQYTAMPRGGHFACLEQPRLFVSDVRKFFRQFRG